MKIFFFTIAMLLFNTGYAALYTFNYANCSFSVPYHGTTVTVAVSDMREYIRNGTHKPQYVGVMRGGYGNPWNVDTESGVPFANEINMCMNTSFGKAGFEHLENNVSYPDNEKDALQKMNAVEADYKLLFIIHDWKSDMITSFTNKWTDVYYDLELTVFNSQNKRLGSARLNGKTGALGKGTSVKKQKLIPPSELVVQMNTLLADKNIANSFTASVVENEKKSDIQTEQKHVIPVGQTKGGKVQDMSGAGQRNDSVVEDLRQYKKLLDEGVITQDDYNAKKKKLLER